MFKSFYVCMFVISKLTEAKLNIDIITSGSNNGEVVVNYSGVESKVITDEDIKLFKIDDRQLKEAVIKHYGVKPTSCYVKSPTPWGDLYKTHSWEQVKRILTIKSARIKNISKKPVIVTSQDFENYSNRSMKVNTGISQSVENSITTSWSKSNEVTVSQEIEYDVNVIFEKGSVKSGLSYTASWGKGEEKAESVTIGSTIAVETELSPGQSATANLSANRGHLELEIVYSVSLRGNVALNFKRKFNDHHFWAPQIRDVMKSGGLRNEFTVVESVKLGFYSDASLKVYDKVTKSPL